MTTALIMGYSNFDLGVFNEKDIRIKIIKKAIRRDLESLAEEGIKWLVFTGNLGFESWVLDVANEMKDEYDFSLATIFDFETHGENWNEANQLKLSQFKQVDFVKYAYPKYEHMGQLRDYQRFLLENTDLAYFFYDPENETKLKFMDNLNRRGFFMDNCHTMHQIVVVCSVDHLFKSHSSICEIFGLRNGCLVFF